MLRSVLSVLLMLPAPALAISLGFQRLADTSTAVPGGSGAFANLEFASVEGGRVVFTGYDGSGQSGVYTSTGGAVGRVVDEATLVPNGGGEAFSFSNHGISDGDTVVFKATSPSDGVGLYRWTAATGAIELLADGNTAIPGGSGDFTAIVHWDAQGGRVAFVGQGSGQEGVYRIGPGGVEVVADFGTSIPSGTGTFDDFGGIGIHAGEVAFRGTDASNRQGIYSDRGGSLARVAEEGMAAPGGSQFESFAWEPGIAGGEIVFQAVMGGGSNPSGIYLDTGSALEAIATELTSIPGGTGTFTSFPGEPSIDEGRVLFRGQGDGFQDGIYLADQSGIHKVLASGDVLDGMIVDLVNMTTSSLDGDQIALVVTFLDEPGGGFPPPPTPEAVYRITLVPEPGTGALLGLGLAALAIRAPARARRRGALTRYGPDRS